MDEVRRVEGEAGKKEDSRYRERNRREEEMKSKRKGGLGKIVVEEKGRG